MGACAGEERATVCDEPFPQQRSPAGLRSRCDGDAGSQNNCSPGWVGVCEWMRFVLTLFRKLKGKKTCAVKCYRKTKSCWITYLI